jgi:hypothetical protein
MGLTKVPAWLYQFTLENEQPEPEHICERCVYGVTDVVNSKLHTLQRTTAAISEV